MNKITFCVCTFHKPITKQLVFVASLLGMYHYEVNKQLVSSCSRECVRVSTCGLFFFQSSKHYQTPVQHGDLIQ